MLKNGWSEKKRFAADTVWFFRFYNVKKHPKKCIFCYFLSKISVVYQFKKLSDKQFDTKVIVSFILVLKTIEQKITKIFDFWQKKRIAMKGSVLFWRKIEKKRTKCFGFPSKFAYPPLFFMILMIFAKILKNRKK